MKLRSLRWMTQLKMVKKLPLITIPPAQERYSQRLYKGTIQHTFCLFVCFIYLTSPAVLVVQLIYIHSQTIQASPILEMEASCQYLSHNQDGFFIPHGICYFTYNLHLQFSMCVSPLDYKLYKGKVICIPEYNIAGPQIIK